jgi:hypothetical protein
MAAHLQSLVWRVTAKSGPEIRSEIPDGFKMEPVGDPKSDLEDVWKMSGR